VKRTFEALGTAVEVTVDDDVGANDIVDLLLAAYPDTSRPPALAFHLRGGAAPALSCAGVYVTPVETVADVVPLFEVDLYHALVEHARPGWLLHAATLERDGRALVFAGPSGAGKTTLTLALVARGWRFVTEEITVIDRDATVTGLARPIHAMHVPSAWRQLKQVLRSPRGPIEATISQPPASVRVTSALPLRALARIGHGRDVSPSLEVMPPHLALRRLWECTLRQDDDGLSCATAILAGRAAHALTSSSVDEAVDLAERL
jgi:hypothetical protein